MHPLFRAAAAIMPPAARISLPALILSVSAAILSVPGAAEAGVTNPDISALGQVVGGYTDDKASSDFEEPTLRFGEMELLLDAYLNPFVRGSFTVSGGEDGFALEEGYAAVVKGLPWGLGLKAGKYRLGFGKINPIHPHAYPFIAPPRSLTALVPGGEEGFNDIGVEVSDLLPTFGDWASTLTAGVIQGQSFHPDEDFKRLGWQGRWANDFLIGEMGALETGVSIAEGKSISPEWDASYLYGADAKAKFYLPNSSQLTVQAEGVYRRFLERGVVDGDSVFLQDNRAGVVAFADYRYHTRWNGGVPRFRRLRRDGGNHPAALDVRAAPARRRRRREFRIPPVPVQHGAAQGPPILRQENHEE
jgi:hypothetical protein